MPVRAFAADQDASATAQQQAPSNLITEVVIEGNQIISTNTILSKMKLQKGAALAQETVNDDLKRLYATGFFQDIRINVDEMPDGYKLIVVVDEKPVVREIVIGGFSRFKEDKLRKSFGVLEGQILDERLIKQGVEAIRKMYADKGYRFVDVDSKIDINAQAKEARVTVRIIEGEKYKVKQINFEGNEAFSDKQLNKLMKTKKDKWFNSGIFKEEYFQKDMERILLNYQKEGYLDARVSHDFEYDKDAQAIVITIAIEEGQHYVTGEIKFEGNRLFPEAEIWQKLDMLPGLTYSQYYLFQDIENIRDYYYERGYMEARVVPDIKLNKDTGKVDVLYQISEGDISFVEKVIIRGNTKTRDIVIRRELRIRPGERFDGAKIQKSKQRLENLGFFEEVTFDTEPGSEPNRRNVVFRVKEKRTGELSFGGGVSSIDRFVGFAEISQKNFDLMNWPRFTGGGQSLSVSARVGSITQDYTISFVEPYLFNKPISLGVDLFNTFRDNRNVDFDERRTGGSVTVSKALNDSWRIGTGYTLERVELDSISDDAPSTVKNFAGTNWLSRIKLFGVYDTRDSVFNPTKGMVVRLSLDFVGSFLGGDQDFYTTDVSLTKYWTIFEKHLLEYKARLGTSDSFGSSSEVPIFDRFYAGGLGTVRGYNYRRVGPIESGDAVGGESIALTSLEYTFPVPRLEGFRGVAFIDAGHVNRDSYKIDIGEFAVSVGPGVKIKTPLGPVAFYYGLPIFNKDTKDENGRFEFSLSRGF